MSDLTSLRERIEKASGPDRELDALTAVTVDEWRLVQDETGWWHAHVGPDDGWNTWGLTRCETQPVNWWKFLEEPSVLPAYTSSLDAALGLVEAKLPGWGWTVESLAPVYPGYSAFLQRSKFDYHSCGAAKPTPALALLSALLSALSDPRP